MRNILILLPMILLLASCCKIKKTTTMSGRFIDYGTGEPIENVRIYVQDGFTGFGPILGNDDIGENEALTYNDGNGEFFVEIKAENNPVLYPSKAGIFRSRAPELLFCFACHAKETKDHRCESKTKIDSASHGKLPLRQIC